MSNQRQRGGAGGGGAALDAYERATDATTGFMERHGRAVRTLAFAGSAAGGLVLFSRLRGFQRLRTAAQVPPAAFEQRWRLRGRVVRVPGRHSRVTGLVGAGDAPAKAAAFPPDVADLEAPGDGAIEFYFFRSPLLRQLLWFTPSTGLTLGEDAIRCRLAGVRLPPAVAAEAGGKDDAELVAADAARELIEGSSGTITLVSPERCGDNGEEGADDACRVLLRVHGGRGDAALRLVRTGAAVTDPDGAGASELAREWPRYWKRLKRAEADVRASRIADGIVSWIKGLFR